MTKRNKLSKGKKIFIIILIVVMGLFFCDTAFRITISHINYNHNKKIEIEFKETLKDNFIDSQKSTIEFKNGVKDSYCNGCGWISIYNANKVLEIDMPIADIIKEIDVWGLNLYGLLGTNPFVVKSFYKSRGYDVQITTQKSSFNERIQQSKVSIIGYFATYGGHYQTVVQHSETEIKLYNSQSITTTEKYFNKYPKSIIFLITIK